MGNWPVGYNSSKAALLAKQEAQHLQRQKDEADRKKKIGLCISAVKEHTKNITQKK